MPDGLATRTTEEARKLRPSRLAGVRHSKATATAGFRMKDKANRVRILSYKLSYSFE